MHLKTRNVNSAFKELIEVFTKQSINHEPEIVKEKTRNGNVLKIEEPVTITYSHPRERVLINKSRNANPFFHLYESLWMLAGRNDIAPLAVYNKKMLDFSDDGKTQNGAYGYRWRNAFHEAVMGSGWSQRSGWSQSDQLDILVKHLQQQPNSRRAVLQMWNVDDDLLKINPRPKYLGGGEWETDGVPPTKDCCCNLSVMFSLRKVEIPKTPNPLVPDSVHYELDMTVTNRSNDLIWGCLGANYVHFTILQEYMAARLEAEVGVYNHFTNNLHVYDWNWKPEEWLASHDNHNPWSGGYDKYNLVKDPNIFEVEVKEFVETFSKPMEYSHTTCYREPFLQMVAAPMMRTFHLYKSKDRMTKLDALVEVQGIQDVAWKTACLDWLQNRENTGNIVSKVTSESGETT